MGSSDDMTVQEIANLGRKLFGERFNCFHQGGRMYVGRFLDDGRYHTGPNAGREIPPHHRKQEVFGCGETWREAFRFATGAGTLFSGAGGPRSGTSRGYSPQYDKFGRLLGWTTPAGLFSKAFPSATIVTA